MYRATRTGQEKRPRPWIGGRTGDHDDACRRCSVGPGPASGSVPSCPIGIFRYDGAVVKRPGPRPRRNVRMEAARWAAPIPAYHLGVREESRANRRPQRRAGTRDPLSALIVRRSRPNGRAGRPGSSGGRRGPGHAARPRSRAMPSGTRSPGSRQRCTRERSAYLAGEGFLLSPDRQRGAHAPPTRASPTVKRRFDLTRNTRNLSTGEGPSRGARRA